MHTPVHAPASGARAAAGRTSSAVYEQLSSEIRAGLISPWDRLTENILSARFGVSRTPVREALTRLVAEHLLERHADGLALVVPDLPTILGLYELRLALELQGLRRVVDGLVDSHDRAVLLEQRGKWSAMAAAPPTPEPRLVAHDEEFHMALLASSGQPVLADALQSVNDKIRAIRMYGYITENRVSDAIQDHLTIVDSVLGSDVEGAMRALSQHVLSSQEAAVTRATQAIATLRLTAAYRSADRSPGIGKHLPAPG